MFNQTREDTETVLFSSLLDVSAQASILNMIVNLQKKLGLTYLFISHNLAVVRFLSSRVGVMYCGKLAELADSRPLYTAPIHPYTQALLASVPAPDPELQTQEIIIEGDVISPINPPKDAVSIQGVSKSGKGVKRTSLHLLK
jgi:oligopeptide transport system ATP-binding protein